MNSKPILFNAPMVRAVLHSRKTQTRRLLKTKSGGVQWNTNDLPGMRQILRSCPYGMPGDQLWVRETFSGPHIMEKSEDFPSMPPSQWPEESPIWYWADGEPTYGDWTRSRPSIHMPRFASRITLEITGVRVERLQDISEQDAMAEGFYQAVHESDSGIGQDVVGWYRTLWESINGPGSWDLNPWVWVVAFQWVTP